MSDDERKRLAADIRRLWWRTLGYDAATLVAELHNDPPTDPLAEAYQLAAAIRISERQESP